MSKKKVIQQSAKDSKKEKEVVASTYTPTWQYQDEKCKHNGGINLFSVDGVAIGGAQVSWLPDTIPATTLLVNCTGRAFTAQTLTRVPKGFESLRQYTFNASVIDIDWPDGDAPAIDAEFWLELPKLAKKNGFNRIVPFCVGSHGRTGTALVSMAIVNLDMNAEDALQFVRTAHCKCAVETYRQCDYLMGIEMWAYKAGMVNHLSLKEIKPYSKPQSAQSAISAITVTADNSMFLSGNK